MSVNPSPIGGFAGQFFDNNGQPLSGGKVYTYAAGTTTPQATYTSALGITPHANPIVLDSAGRVPGGEIWLTDGLIYKFVIETSLAVLIGTYDNITGVNSNFVNYTVQEEVITATAGQTVFNLSTINYTPGTNSLSVYIDGVNQYVGDSYLETDSNTVTFTSGVHVGAEVKFTTAVQTTTGAMDASMVGYTAGFTGATGQTVQTKLEQYVSVKDFGAVGDGVTDDSAAIQAAINYAASNGSRIVLFPQGKSTANGAAYNIGSTTITVPCSEMKLVGQKYTQIRKTGAGAFFDIPVIGYGFEAEGLWLVGTNVDGQYGFLFSGASNGSYMQGTLEAHIHDCWFEAVGKKETVTAAAGGAILVTSQTLGLKVEGNICSQGGYLLRVEAASDGILVSHNVTNISRSVAVQFENTAGAASVEISQNNLANVGGGVFLKNAGYCNVFGNACIPGESEAGALGDVVKRTITAGEVFLTEDVATGVSATIWIDNCQTPNINQNVCSFGGGAQNSDYGIYLSTRQSTCFVSNNFVVGHLIAGLFVWSGQPQILTNNRSSNAQKDTVYSDPLHPSITHNYTLVAPSFNNYHGWGTAIASGPYEFCSPGSAATDGFVQLRVSNANDRNEYIGFGWDDTGSVGYIQSYKTGVGYQAIRHRSPSLFLGQNDTSVVIQASSAQGSNLLRVTDNTNTANYIQVGPTGSITLNIPSTFPDNAAALAGGLTVGRLYKTATGDVKVVY